MTDESRVHKISHSDIVSFDKCQYSWYYGRYMNLMPVDGYPDVMMTGTFGHTLMECAFTVIMNGGTYEEAAEESGKLLIDVLDKPLMAKVYRNVLAFVAWFLEQNYRAVEIEKKQSIPIPGTNYEFGFTPDLIAESTVGPTRGSLSIWDYKFTGQYWSDRMLNAWQQVPKYIAARNKRTGDNIRRGAIVMLNTRATSSDTGNKLFLVKWVPLNSHRMNLLMEENERDLEKIYRLQQIGDTEGTGALKKQLTHTADQNQCKFCFFADDLCPGEQMGRDITKQIKANYKPNKDYGYNGEQDDKSSTDAK